MSGARDPAVTLARLRPAGCAFSLPQRLAGRLIFQHEAKMTIHKIRFRQPAHAIDKATFPGTCGRNPEDECGMKEPLQCKVHGPLLLEPSREESEKAIAQARAISQTIATGLGGAPGTR
jgi:hypothetical protein